MLKFNFKKIPQKFYKIYALTSLLWGVLHKNVTDQLWGVLHKNATDQNKLNWMINPSNFF